jgi:hypothetical protein
MSKVSRLLLGIARLDVAASFGFKSMHMWPFAMAAGAAAAAAWVHVAEAGFERVVLMPHGVAELGRTLAVNVLM